MLIPKFTEDYRQELRRRGRHSLFFFGVSVLGFDAFDDDLGRSTIAPVHMDLCAFLEGCWSLALVCAARGLGKSTWTTMIYPLWRTLHIKNFTCKIIEATDDNAKVNHFLPMLLLFTESPRASFLQWLYQEEIPPGFAGWNSERINWVKDRPEVGDSISYWGLTAKWEGAHPDLVVGDDLEGADAGKSDIPSQMAWDGFQRMLPLRRNAARSQILLTGTPHGDRPFVWQVKDVAEQMGISIFWRPLLRPDSEDVSEWPERFPPEVVAQLRGSDIWDQQYMLRRAAEQSDLFNMGAVRAGCYKTDPQMPGMLDYESFEFNPDQLDELGFMRPTPKKACVRLEELRFFLHIDPLHRTDAKKRKVRPADAGQVVVGIAPDMHAFAVATWSKDREQASLEMQAAQAFRFYQRYACHLVSFEGIGAQVWMRSFVEAMEKSSPTWAYPRTDGVVFAPADLPRMSTRMIESERSDKAKEHLWRERLTPWMNYRLLHLHAGQEELLHQIENCMDETTKVDLLDALAQGPGRIVGEQNDGRNSRHDAGKMIWSAPLPREHLDGIARRQKMTKLMVDPRTGWAPFWDRP